jgi:hypothetical protein
VEILIALQKKNGGRAAASEFTDEILREVQEY